MKSPTSMSLLIALALAACGGGVSGGTGTTTVASTASASSAGASTGAATTGSSSGGSTGSTGGTGGGSSSGGTTGGASGGADAGFVEASHPLLPLVPDQGGPVLSQPTLVTVTWAGDALASSLGQFDGWIVDSSDYFGLVLAQYGVDGGTAAAGSPLPPIDGGTLDDQDVGGLLLGAIDAGYLPPPTAQSLYVLYPPAGLTITQSGYQGCVDFQGYHFSVAADPGPPLIYAMVPRCTVAAQQSGFSALDYTTWGASHEIAEAATDPLFEQPAWLNPSPTVGEIGDVCDGYPIRVDGHLVTALFSNAAAAADQRACLPAPAGPNFGIFPVPPVITVSTGDAGTATAQVYAAASLSLAFATRADAQTIATTPAQGSASNGSAIALTVTVAAGTPSGQHFVELYVEDSQQDYHAQSFLEVDVP